MGRQQIQKKNLKLIFKEYYPLFDKIQHNSYLSGGHTMQRDVVEPENPKQER